MTPDLAEIIRRAQDARIDEIHVSFPGKIVDYDAATQTATVEIQVRRPLATDDDDDDGVRFEEMPHLPGVRVVFPGSGAYSITWPVGVGDTVLIVCPTFDPSGWIVDGVLSDPALLLSHGLTGCFAIPGLRHLGNVVPTAAASATALVIEAPEIRLTKEATTSHDWIGIGKKTEDAMKDLASKVNDAGSGVTGWVAITGFDPDCSSTKVKAK